MTKKGNITKNNVQAWLALLGGHESSLFSAVFYCLSLQLATCTLAEAFQDNNENKLRRERREGKEEAAAALVGRFDLPFGATSTATAEPVGGGAGAFGPFPLPPMP